MNELHHVEGEKRMRTNRVLEKLRRNEPVWVATLWTVPHWKIVEMMGIAGFDCVWLEMEHSDFTLEQMSQMILAARATGMETMVRIPRGSYNEVIKPLEAGAGGLLLPHVTGAADAQEFVRMAKFSPLGWRGMGGSVDNQYGSVPVPEYIEWANRETFCAVMIERKEAVEDVDAIAATEGIDLLYIGPADLSQSYGVIGQWTHPLIQGAIDRVAAACAKHGKAWGCAGGMSVSALMEKGARFFTVASEHSVLMSGFRQAMQRVQNLSGAGEELTSSMEV
jgi:2-keto-3-deoxy-L-rhamnonate aldolase RhmA